MNLPDATTVSCNIPFSCMYNNTTALTKSGSLIKTIKLTHVLGGASTLKCIQEAMHWVLQDHSDQFAVWINTVRKEGKTHQKSQVYSTGNYALTLAAKHENNVLQKDHLCNEVYISIVSESVLGKIGSISDFLLLQIVKKSKLYCDEILASLQQVVEKLTDKLKSYNPQVLCEIQVINFISFLLCNQESNKEPTIIDISTDIAKSNKIFFGFNAFEIKTDKEKTFGAILNLKCYTQTTNFDFISDILSLNFHLFITECIMSASLDEAEKRFCNLKDLNNIYDEEDKDWNTQLNKIKTRINNKKDEFCLRTLSITIFSDVYNQLKERIYLIERLAKKHGILVRRHDLLTENFFWLNFPGNFAYLSKKEVMHISHTCAFASTYMHFLSSDIKNHIVKFASIKNQPHFFCMRPNHKPDNIIISGGEYTDNIALQNFLIISDLVKNNTNIMIIDSNHASEIFIKAIDGQYFDIRLDDSDININVLDIEDDDAFISTLHKMCSNQESKNRLKNLEHEISLVSKQDRTLTKLEKYLNKFLGSTEIIKSKFNHFFSEGIDQIKFTDKVCISLDKLLSNDQIASLIAFYLLHKYIEFSKKENKKFIIAIQDFYKFKNAFSSQAELEKFLLTAQQNNGIVIFTSYNKKRIFDKSFAQILTNYAKTKITLNQDMESDFVQNLEDVGNESQILCLLEQNEQKIMLKLDFFAHKEANALAADESKLHYMKQAIEEAGKNSRSWLPIFYQKCESNHYI